MVNGSRPDPQLRPERATPKHVRKAIETVIEALIAAAVGRKRAWDRLPKGEKRLLIGLAMTGGALGHLLTAASDWLDLGGTIPYDDTFEWIAIHLGIGVLYAVCALVVTVCVFPRRRVAALLIGVTAPSVIISMSALEPAGILKKLTLEANDVAEWYADNLFIESAFAQSHEEERSASQRAKWIRLTGLSEIDKPFYFGVTFEARPDTLPPTVLTQRGQFDGQLVTSEQPTAAIPDTATRFRVWINGVLSKPMVLETLSPQTDTIYARVEVRYPGAWQMVKRSFGANIPRWWPVVRVEERRSNGALR